MNFFRALQVLGIPDAKYVAEDLFPDGAGLATIFERMLEGIDPEYTNLWRCSYGINEKFVSQERQSEVLGITEHNLKMMRKRVRNILRTPPRISILTNAITEAENARKKAPRRSSKRVA